MTYDDQTEIFFSLVIDSKDNIAQDLGQSMPGSEVFRLDDRSEILFRGAFSGQNSLRLSLELLPATIANLVLDRSGPHSIEEVSARARLFISIGDVPGTVLEQGISLMRWGRMRVALGQDAPGQELLASLGFEEVGSGHKTRYFESSLPSVLTHEAIASISAGNDLKRFILDNRINWNRDVAAILVHPEVDPEDIARIARAISRAFEAVGGKPLELRDGGTGIFRAKVRPKVRV